jgi:hypothetical protein
VEYGSCVASDGSAARGNAPLSTGDSCSSGVIHEQVLLQKILPYTKQKTSVAKEAVMLPATTVRLLLQPSQFARSCRPSLLSRSCKENIVTARRCHPMNEVLYSNSNCM